MGFVAFLLLTGPGGGKMPIHLSGCEAQYSHLTPRRDAVDMMRISLDTTKSKNPLSGVTWLCYLGETLDMDSGPTW